MFFLGTSCYKNIPPDTNNNNIHGVAFYSDYYSGNTLPLSNQTVYIKPMNGATLLAEQTDSLGNFYFTGLDKKQQYIVYTNPIIVTDSSFSAPYYGVSNAIAPNNTAGDSIIATISSTSGLANTGIIYEGIRLKTADAAGGEIGGAGIFLYHSQTLFKTDTVAPFGTGAFTAIKTDANGNAMVFWPDQGNSGTLYVRAYYALSNGRILKDSIITTLSKGSFVTGTLHLQ